MLKGTERGATDTTLIATGGAIHGITIITSTVCFTFLLQMSFLVRAAARSGFLGVQMARTAPACQWRLFSTDAEEKIVTPSSQFESQNRQKMQDMMVEKLKKQADATVVKITTATAANVRPSSSVSVFGVRLSRLMNCGKKARKNRITFGFSRFIVIPIR